jgi:hypothetical protein
MYICIRDRHQSGKKILNVKSMVQLREPPGGREEETQ